MASKPWRTVIISEETGRFTIEQIRDAVRAAMAHTEAKRLRKAKAAERAKAKAAAASERALTEEKRGRPRAGDAPRGVRKAATPRSAARAPRNTSRKEPAP
jgi:hypothetical protein